ncbi:EF-hand domain-containing protein [Sphingobium sp. H39-3-25]|uniref:EF-hand domain-containing protein n=1 Tax=Sphingobium arseniciresistens TaxID=3030834 RepID=UPI0023B99062|nr:EF-hand domain-containing protein [Sphingobium arseniciresistens]
MKRFLITTAIGALFVGGLAATHVAFAQGEDGPHGFPGRGGARMEMADTNKDGTLTRAELTASLEQRFAAMDVNKDGKFTKEDREALRQKRYDEMFAKMDADHNGQISKAEMQAAHDARKAERAKDGPGKDGPGKGRRGWGGHGPHRMGMGPGMGGPDGPPPPGGPGMGPMGKRGDANADGALTREEFMAPALAKFDRMDTNKDGKVTKEERDAARATMRGRLRDRGDMPPPPPPPAAPPAGT